MKAGLLLIIAIFLTAFTSIDSLNGKWKPVQYKDLKTGETEFEPAEFKDKDVVTFEFKDNNEKVEFIGKTVRNKTPGEYTLFSDDKIKVSSFGGKIGDPNWGDFENYLSIYKV